MSPNLPKWNRCYVHGVKQDFLNWEWACCRYRWVRSGQKLKHKLRKYASVLSFVFRIASRAWGQSKHAQTINLLALVVSRLASRYECILNLVRNRTLSAGSEAIVSTNSDAWLREWLVLSVLSLHTEDPAMLSNWLYWSIVDPRSKVSSLFEDEECRLVNESLGSKFEDGIWEEVETRQEGCL